MYMLRSPTFTVIMARSRMRMAQHTNNKAPMFSRYTLSGSMRRLVQSAPAKVTQVPDHLRYRVSLSLRVKPPPINWPEHCRNRVVCSQPRS